MNATNTDVGDLSNDSFLENVTLPLGDGEEETDFNPVTAATISNILFTYVAPVLIFVGVFGNSLSVAILQSSTFRRAPSSFILSALAVVDSGVLLTGLLRHWIRGLTLGRLDVRNLSDATCKAHYFFTYMLPHLSSWTLVLMTIERLISVTVPMKSREICSRKRMIVAWFCILAALVALNLQCVHNITLITIPGPPDTVYCFFTPEAWDFGTLVWPWIDLVVLSIAPVLIIFSANLLIVSQVVRASRRRSEQMQVKGGSGEDTSRSLTFMLISVSMVFLLTTIPSCIYFIGVAVNLWPLEPPEELFKTEVAYVVVNILYYFNNCMNFFLYCVSGSRFRDALIRVLCCGRGGRDRKSKSNAAATMTTDVTSGDGKSGTTSRF